MGLSSSAARDSVLISRHNFGEVWLTHSNNQRMLIATRDFVPGDILGTISRGKILSSPTYLTVQQSDTEHFMLQPEFLQYINHSCRPNVFFDLDAMQVVCVRPVKAGDELTYFYPATEWDMAQPFDCRCGETNCLGTIQGARHLPKEVLRSYRFTRFILGKLAGR
jgi:hypothetical protein